MSDDQQKEQQTNGTNDNNGVEQTNSQDEVKEDDRKLFVGGLSWETTEKELKEHFIQYGEITNISLKTDPATGRSRGFAFIIFKSVDALNNAFAAGDHVINGKKIDPKKAKAKQEKVFVGGLPSDVTNDEIKEFFGKWGVIVNLEVPFDKMKNQRKGYCFITYESSDKVQDLFKTAKQTIKGKEVDVKKAAPKPANPYANPKTMRGRGAARGAYPPQGYDYYGGAAYPGYEADYYGSYGYAGYDYGYGYEAPPAPVSAARGRAAFNGAGKARGTSRGSGARHAPY
ncbi:RNA-binding protein squid-like isoform X2 [Adelges cooleyi]|uniref:RNA-binding protein squid-like isoform X2 n=1 Tax=Adelges cooleyi TaxID=133065 RepID=UPI002180538C|nr:RNA-binding protein squid-like isoform X2 [Adelges cooleyi]